MHGKKTPNLVPLANYNVISNDISDRLVVRVSEWFLPTWQSKSVVILVKHHRYLPAQLLPVEFQFCVLLLQVEHDLNNLRGDLKTWLNTKTEDDIDPTIADNPFAYAVGVSQTRFGDDFDHQRMARYDVSLVCAKILV